MQVRNFLFVSVAAEVWVGTRDRPHLRTATGGHLSRAHEHSLALREDALAPTCVPLLSPYNAGRDFSWPKYLLDSLTLCVCRPAGARTDFAPSRERTSLGGGSEMEAMFRLKADLLSLYSSFVPQHYDVAYAQLVPKGGDKKIIIDAVVCGITRAHEMPRIACLM